MDSSGGFFFTFDAPSEATTAKDADTTGVSSSASPSTWPPATICTAQFPWVSVDAAAESRWTALYCSPTSPDSPPTRPRQLTVSSSSDATTAPASLPFTLCYQTSPEVRTLTSVSADTANAAATATTEQRDVIPGRYYGGLKVWSCAPLLAEYLGEHAAHYKLLLRTASVVVELGCGQGLPGLAAICLGARSVAFQDYNEEVLEVCTKPNLGATIAANRALLTALHGSSSAAGVRVKFVHGDWVDLKWGGQQDTATSSSPAEEDEFCDVILGADVTFDKEACDKLACVLQRWLRPRTGEAIIASKDYYFGTNGGHLEFTRSAEMHGLGVTLLKRVDTADKMPHVVLRVAHRSA